MNKANLISDKVRVIFSSVALESTEGRDFDFSMTLKENGLSSVSFLKVLVKIEEEFGIEIPDEDLDFDKYDRVEDVKDLVLKTLREPENE